MALTLPILFRRGWLAFACVLIICGCGRTDTSPLASASGRISYAGSPLSGAQVSFVPIGVTRGQGGEATTGADGTFVLRAPDHRPGVAAGEYRVVVTKWQMPDGVDFSASPGVALMDSGARQALPWQYSHERYSTLRATVPDEGGQFDFSLQPPTPRVAGP